MKWDNIIKSSQSELNLINRQSIECFLAKSIEKIKSSSRKWRDVAIIVESFIYHSRRSCWGQDNYTICSQSAVKTFHFSLQKVFFNSLWIEANPFSSFFWLAIFPSDVSLMNISWRFSGFWAAQCLVVWNWSLRSLCDSALSFYWDAHTHMEGRRQIDTQLHDSGFGQM